MINRALRDQLAVRIEAFLRGEIDGAALGRGLERVATASHEAGDPDRAISAVAVRLWQEFPDPSLGGVFGGGAEGWPATRASGRLSAASWNAFVRAALFLRSDREIGWPEDQWDPYDALGSPPDLLALFMVAAATLTGLAGLILILCRQWGPGLVLALIAAGLAGLFSRLGDRPSKGTTQLAGDPSAFPFLSQSEVVEELGRQGEPRVPFRPEAPNRR